MPREPHDLSGTGVVTSGITYVGAGVGANGTLTQSGGTQNTSFLNVGLLGGATGTFNMSDGQATISDSMNVGGFAGSSGTVHQSGGNVNVAFVLTVNGSGSYNLSDGSLTAFRMVIGDNDAGATVTQTGGAVSIGNSLVLGNAAGATGHLAMDASAGNGTSSVVLTGAGATVVIGQSGTATMTMEGGSTLAVPVSTAA